MKIFVAKCPNCGKFLPWSNFRYRLEHFKETCLSYPSRVSCPSCKTLLEVRWPRIYWIAYFILSFGSMLFLGVSFTGAFSYEALTSFALVYMLAAILIFCRFIFTIPLIVETDIRRKNSGE